MWTLEQITHI